MKNNLKILSLLTLLLVGLAAIPAVTAADFVFDEVKIDGNVVDGNLLLAVERGDSLDLQVGMHLYNATEDEDNLRLDAEIGGYEDLIRDYSGLFKLSASGATQYKSLTLDLPADLESGEYTLYIRINNHEEKIKIPLYLEVIKTRHLIDVQDVLVSDSNLEAGENMFVTVRLENMGANTEKNIKVSVSAFGEEDSTYVDLLGTEDIDAYAHGLQTAESTKPLLIKVPEDAVAGEYDLVVKVSYNRGREVVEEVLPLVVVGDEEAKTDALKAIVSVDTTSQSIAQGKETVYKLTIANLGSETQLFSANVVGTHLWADVRVDPGFVSVEPQTSGSLYVYVKAHDDAELGNHLFNLQLQAGDNLAKEIPLGANVVESEDSNASAVNLMSSSTLKLGFVGLVVLVVVIGLVVALRKLKDDDEYPLEPKDGQTYY